MVCQQLERLLRNICHQAGSWIRLRVQLNIKHSLHVHRHKSQMKENPSLYIGAGFSGDLHLVPDARP